MAPACGGDVLVEGFWPLSRVASSAWFAEQTSKLPAGCEAALRPTVPIGRHSKARPFGVSLGAADAVATLVVEPVEEEVVVVVVVVVATGGLYGIPATWAWNSASCRSLQRDQAERFELGVVAHQGSTQPDQLLNSPELPFGFLER